MRLQLTFISRDLWFELVLRCALRWSPMSAKHSFLSAHPMRVCGQMGADMRGTVAPRYSV